MEIVARAFPVRSKEAAIELGRAIDEWPAEKKAPMAEAFGGDGREHWFYQEIEDKPHVVSVAIVADAAAGYEFLQTSDDEFTQWFRGQVAELSLVNLSDKPRGPASEFIYEFKPD